MTVRIADIDAPKTHPPRCRREAVLGARATKRLRELLSAAALFVVSAIAWNWPRPLFSTLFLGAGVYLFRSSPG